ncbi:MAG: DUF1801 domain-containing protein [Rhodobacteraceae bacterium]|nr:DUF1801 domain-containing protein [Paracoccaceae bacterium]
MAEAKTRPSGIDPEAVLAAVTPERRQQDARRLEALFRKVTGFEPVVWAEYMMGYGRYRYTYASGHSGECLATGFAPRKRELVLYVMPGYGDFEPILDRLGPYRKGKACLYLTRLDRVDMDVLADLIRAGLEDLKTRWPVTAA